MQKETSSLMVLPQLQKKKQLESNFFKYADEHNLTRYPQSNASTTLRQSMKSSKAEFERELANSLTQREYPKMKP